MKTWLNSKTGQRLPGIGYPASCQLSTSGRTAGKRLEIFICGEGRRTEPVANWTAEEIPALRKNFTVVEYRAYAEAYGKYCAMQHLQTCDMMKETEHALLTNMEMPCDDDLEWFEATFHARYRHFLMPLASAFGIIAFDILAFEKHLAKQFGYPSHLDGSMAAFMNQRFGAGETARFEALCLSVAAPAGS